MQILIYLHQKTFRAYGDFQIKNTYDEFYTKETFEIPRINVIDLSRDLLISKETTRRKILELERDGVIKKDKKKVSVLVGKMSISISNKSKTLYQPVWYKLIYSYLNAPSLRGICGAVEKND